MPPMPSDESESIVMAAAGDDHFAMPMAVMFYSAMVHLPADAAVTVYILDAGITPANQARLKKTLLRTGRRVSVEYLAADIAVFASMPLAKFTNASTYLRLLLPDLVPADCNKVLFLDGDTIVRADVTELWRHELSPDEGVAAVRDQGVAYIGGPLGILEIYQQESLRADAPYFNAGVLLINVAYWRQHEICKRVVEFTTRHYQHIRFVEQDGLNALLAGHWRELDLLWNVQVAAIRTFKYWHESPYKDQIRPRHSTALSDGKILHFTSIPKPWLGGIRNPARPVFDEYLKKSGWFNPMQYWIWLFGRLKNNILDIAKFEFKKRFGFLSK